MYLQYPSAGFLLGKNIQPMSGACDIVCLMASEQRSEVGSRDS